METITLKINNSECQLEGLSIQQYNVAKNALSYKINQQQAFFSRGPAVRYLIDKKGVFPSGLLYIVERLIRDNGWVVNRIDTRVIPKRNHGLYTLNLPYPLYLDQEAIIAKCLTQPRGVISAPTGFGKSITMAALINAYQLKSLIVVPNLELKRQLTETFKSMFSSMEHITIENIDKVKLFTLTNYDLLIIDECHHSAASTYRKLNKKAWKSIYYRFSFTATPFRSRDEEQLLYESVAGQVIYTVDYEKAVGQNVIVPLEAYYVEMPKIKTKEIFTKYDQAYKELIVNNPIRNNIVANVLHFISNSGASILGLVKQIDHGASVEKLTNCMFTHGDDKYKNWKLEMFSNGRLKGLIATYQVAGEGVDTRACEYVLIATPVKSKNLFMQMVGRAFRKFPGKESAKVILVRDFSHKWFLTAFREQCKILREEYNVVPSKLEVG